MADFAATYRELVVPRLRDLCLAHGSSIAHGLEDFSTAHTRIIRIALTLGAAYLAPERLEELEDHLAATLCRAAWDIGIKLGVE